MRWRAWWSAWGAVGLGLAVGCGPEPLVFPTCEGIECESNRRDNATPRPVDFGSPDLGSPDFGNPNNGNPNNGTPDMDPGDGCVLGASQCYDGEQFQRCVDNDSGGTSWSLPSYCAYALCSPVSESCCDAPCPQLGDKRCGSGGVQTCIEVDGCRVWGQPEACPNSESCAGPGVCQGECVSTCVVGEQRCAMEGGPEYVRCEDVGGGCLQFGANTFSCGSGRTCVEGECFSDCSNTCPMLGDKRCQGATEQECTRNSDGCLSWTPTGNPAACGPTCTDRCSGTGQTRCATGNVQQECRMSADGCLDWTNAGSCPAPNLATCFSNTLGGVDVPHGTCVQNAPTNKYHTCSNGSQGCLWAFCNNGSWDYQCPRGTPGACAATLQNPHAQCFAMGL